MRQLKTQRAEMRRRAEKFLRWAEWYIGRPPGNGIVDDKCAVKLADVLEGAGRFLLRKEAARHRRLVESAQAAMPGILKAIEVLKETYVRGTLDVEALKASGELEKSSHALTRALIREGL